MPLSIPANKLLQKFQVIRRQELREGGRNEGRKNKNKKIMNVGRKRGKKIRVKEERWREGRKKGRMEGRKRDSHKVDSES